MEKQLMILKYAKALLAIALFISIFLPFSSCTRTVDEVWLKNNGIPAAEWNKYRVTEQRKTADGKIEPVSVYRVKEYHYIYKSVKPELESVVFLLLFLWPLPLLAGQYLVKQERVRLAFWFAQPPAAIVSGYYIFDSFIVPEIGAYLSFSSDAGLLAVWIAEAVILLVLRRRRAPR